MSEVPLYSTHDRPPPPEARHEDSVQPEGKIITCLGANRFCSWGRIITCFDRLRVGWLWEGGAGTTRA